jgi:hypothetical protein
MHYFLMCLILLVPFLSRISESRAHVQVVQDLPYTPGTPVAINGAAMDIGRITITGPVEFANPTGGTIPKEKMIKILITADKPYPVKWGDKYQARFGYGPLPQTTGGGVTDMAGWQYDERNQTWGFAATTQQPPRLVGCTISFGTLDGPPLTNQSLSSPTYCTVPGAAVVAEVQLRVNSGNPSIVPSRQTGMHPPENLVDTPLTIPSGRTLACARVVAEAGLAGIPCQAGLKNVAIPDGEWSMGVHSGTVNGITHEAVVTFYYWVQTP